MQKKSIEIRVARNKLLAIHQEFGFDKEFTNEEDQQAVITTLHWLDDLIESFEESEL